MIRAIAWSIDCEGEVLGAWSGERPDWCSISVTVTTRDRDQAWMEATEQGWQHVAHEVDWETCPGCVKALLHTKTIQWTKLHDHRKWLTLANYDLPQGIRRAPQESGQVDAANKMISDLAAVVKDAALALFDAPPREGVILPVTAHDVVSSFDMVLQLMKFTADDILAKGLDAALTDPRLNLHLSCESEDCVTEVVEHAVNHLNRLAAAMQSAGVHARSARENLDMFFVEWDYTPQPAVTDLANT